ncbi:MAG: hypothetical protein C9356_09195 [Oleiphilus sp.]|nr:MAG: hypothetical protein C9356_09195 [Oleiphilus sp.]
MANTGTTKNYVIPDGPWPSFPKPLPDEIFSSWLARLARANFTEPCRFTSMYWPKTNIWNQDLDASTPVEFIQYLSQKARIDQASIEATLLTSLIGRYMSEIDTNGGQLGILAVKTIGAKRQSFGMQFCPRCLEEDRIPYYRRSWRLTPITICSKHLVKLADRCAKCESPANFHHLSLFHSSLAFCWQCGSELTRITTEEICPQSGVAKFNDLILEGLTTGWVRINEETPIMMPMFLEGIWRMVRPFLRNKHARRFEESFRTNGDEGFVGLDSFTFGSRIDRLPTSDRFKLGHVLGHLLCDWPNRFVGFCINSNITRKPFRRNVGIPPYWLAKVLNTELNKKPYWTSEMEFDSAISYLIGRGYQLSRGNIGSALGLNRSLYLNPERTKKVKRLINKQKLSKDYERLSPVFNFCLHR